MSDQPPTAPVVVNPPAPGSPTPAPSPVSGQPVNTDAVPYARFKEVNDKLRELERKEQEREETARKAQEDEQKKRGEFEQLLKDKEKELEALRGFKATRENEEKAERDKLIEKLTDKTPPRLGSWRNNRYAGTRRASATGRNPRSIRGEDGENWEGKVTERFHNGCFHN